MIDARDRGTTRGSPLRAAPPTSPHATHRRRRPRRPHPRPLAAVRGRPARSATATRSEPVVDEGSHRSPPITWTQVCAVWEMRPASGSDVPGGRLRHRRVVGHPAAPHGPGKVAQILHNLVSKALRHTATGGVRVHPRLSDDGKSVAWVPARERLELRFLVGAGRQAVRLDLHPHRPRPRPSEGQRARAHARARRPTTRTNGRAY